LSINVQIDYSIKVRSPFHIGSGYSRGLTDRAILKDSRDMLYIPGSVIKGNVRYIAENFADHFGISHCVTHELTSLKCIGNDPCIICRIFGNTKNEGGLYFDNATISSADESIFSGIKSLQTQERTRAMINRRFNIAEHGALFVTEYGEKDIVFHSGISGVINDITPQYHEDLNYEVALLLASLASLERLGGDRSCGNGWVEIEIDPENSNPENKNIKINNEEIKITRIINSDIFEFMPYENEQRKGGNGNA
jgi:CRISPR/Cas system CSM-associated protein Csm3 (group 7 of RAMP superfamily)